MSSYAYQGGGRDIDRSILDSLSSICLANFKPDLTIFLDIDPEQGLERIKIRGAIDRIEQESIDFFQKVSRGYKERLDRLDNVRIINARQPLEKVKEEITNHLQEFLKTL